MDERRKLEAIYDEHAAAMYGLLLNLLRDQEPTRDVMQELFRKLVTHPDRIAHARNPRAYLLRVAHNEAIDFIRHRSAADRRDDVFALSDPELFEPAADPDAMAFESALTSALAELPSEQRAVVHLKLWEHLTFEAIATLLDIPPNTAASRYRYGIDKLRSLLRPVYDELK